MGKKGRSKGPSPAAPLQPTLANVLHRLDDAERRLDDAEEQHALDTERLEGEIDVLKVTVELQPVTLPDAVSDAEDAD